MQKHVFLVWVCMGKPRNPDVENIFFVGKWPRIGTGYTGYTTLGENPFAVEWLLSCILWLYLIIGGISVSLSLYLHIYIWSWSKGPCRDSPLGRPPVLHHETRRTFFPEFAKDIIFILAKDLAKDCWMRWFIIYLSFSFSRCEVRTFGTELWQ